MKKETSVQLAIKAHKAFETAPWEPYDDGFQGPPLQIRQVIVGDFIALDPCHREHSMYEPYLWRCKRFWDSLKRQLEKRGHHMNWNEDGQPIISETRTVGKNGQPLKHIGDGQYAYASATA